MTGWLARRREAKRRATEESATRINRINSRRCPGRCIVCDYFDTLCRYTEPENLHFLGIVADARIEHTHDTDAIRGHQ